MRLQEIMTTKVVTIGPGETADAAWTRMRRRDIRHLVVMDHSGVVGVLSERDLGGRMGAATRRNRKVRDLMTPRVATAPSTTEVKDAAELMRKKLIGSLPVVDDGELVGIVTATDVFEELSRTGSPHLSRAEQQLLRSPAASKRLGGRPVTRRRNADEASPAGSSRARKTSRAEPLAETVSKATKRASGRTATADVPANIRVIGTHLSDNDRDYIRERLGARLGKYADVVERVSVRVSDVNGPRGGSDQRCVIKVVLSTLPSVVFESQAAALKTAVNGALSGVERAVGRSVTRSRAIPKVKGGVVPALADEEGELEGVED